MNRMKPLFPIIVATLFTFQAIMPAQALAQPVPEIKVTQADDEDDEDETVAAEAVVTKSGFIEQYYFVGIVVAAVAVVATTVFFYCKARQQNAAPQLGAFGGAGAVAYNAVQQTPPGTPGQGGQAGTPGSTKFGGAATPGSNKFGRTTTTPASNRFSPSLQEQRQPTPFSHQAKTPAPPVTDSKRVRLPGSEAKPASSWKAHRVTPHTSSKNAPAPSPCSPEQQFYDQVLTAVEAQEVEVQDEAPANNNANFAGGAPALALEVVAEEEVLAMEIGEEVQEEEAVKPASKKKSSKKKKKAQTQKRPRRNADREIEQQEPVPVTDLKSRAGRPLRRAAIEAALKSVKKMPKLDDNKDGSEEF